MQIQRKSNLKKRSATLTTVTCIERMYVGFRKYLSKVIIVHSNHNMHGMHFHEYKKDYIIHNKIYLCDCKRKIKLLSLWNIVRFKD